MADRFHQDLETALSSYSRYSIVDDDYVDEEEETDEEYEEEQIVLDAVKDDKSDELACPFCFEDFDVLGLCCHIDADHRMEVKPGICPVCATKVRINMASHLITQHESILKILCNKQHRSARARSAMFSLRKDMQEKHLRSIKESPCANSSSDPAVDSKLLSFVNHREPSSRPQTVGTADSTVSDLSVKNSSSGSSDRTQPSLIADSKDERARRCGFVQGLVLSMMFDDL